MALQSASVAVFVDKVEVVGGFQSFHEPNDVLVLEGRKDIDFVDCQLLEFGVGFE